MKKFPKYFSGTLGRGGFSMSEENGDNIKVSGMLAWLKSEKPPYRKPDALTWAIGLTLAAILGFVSAW